ncbi:MAG: tetratricopeptide repeat protein [Gemmatimonas sp.]
MNVPAANTTRASLEVARVALGRMMGAPPAPGAPRALPMTMANRASDAWKSSEILLRALTGRSELSGQALLAEARRIDTLDMEGMHAMVAMREWVERTLAPGSAAQMLTLPPTDAEREVGSNALAALQRAMGDTTATVTANPSPTSEGLPTRSTLSNLPESGSRSTWAPQATEPAMPQGTVAPSNDSSNVLDDHGGKRSVSSGLIMGVVLLIVCISGAAAYFYVHNKDSAAVSQAASPSPATSSTSNASSATDEGAAAYARGAKEGARLAFVKAIAENPDDVLALTYLGRIAREQGSMATAREYLERAIRVDPNNAVASRELASALLADKQYELARRFYVRALTIDPTDRIAQGFLGCALVRLNRAEEAARWIERAGPGDWSNCAAPAVVIPPAKD